MNKMILTRKRGANLLFALKRYYKLNNNKSFNNIQLCEDIINRYKYVLLISNNTKFICNNPKYLKKWIMFENLRNIQPIKYL